MNAPLCTLTMREIISITAQHFAVSVVDLLSPRRDANIVAARNAAAYIIRELLPRSYPQIGRALGGRDHTTIMAACASTADDMATDPAYAAKVEAIRDFCLPARSLDVPDTDPFEAASRILRSPREATGVSLETIRDLAAIAVAALQEATRQEAARANELARQARDVAEPATPAPSAEVEQLRAELAEAKAYIAELTRPLHQVTQVIVPSALVQSLREWTEAHDAHEGASPAHARSAHRRELKARLDLAEAARTHFNLRTPK